MSGRHHATMGVGPFDLHWFHIINGWAGTSPLLDRLAAVLANDAVEIWAVIFLLLWFWPPRRVNRARRAVVYAVVAGVVALAINALLTHAFPYRPRPFVYLPRDQVHLLLTHAPDSSFPSDHAAGSFAFAVSLFYARARDGWWALLLAAAVGVARVMTGLHWPTDVLVGAAVGVVSAALVLALRGLLEPLVRWLFRVFRFLPARIGERA